VAIILTGIGHVQERPSPSSPLLKTEWKTCGGTVTEWSFPLYLCRTYNTVSFMNMTTSKKGHETQAYITKQTPSAAHPHTSVGQTNSFGDEASLADGVAPDAAVELPPFAF